MLVTKNYRGKKYGQQILRETIKQIKDNSDKESIYISAQEYLERFYSSFGFEKVSDMYLEDNIPHIDMVLNIKR